MLRPGTTARSSGTNAESRARTSGGAGCDGLHPRAQPAHLTGERRELARQREQGRRLARAVRAEQRDDLAGRDGEVEVAHRGEIAVTGREPARVHERPRRSSPGRGVTRARAAGSAGLSAAFRRRSARRGTRRSPAGRGGSRPGSPEARCRPRVEHGDAIADAEHERDVVLDHQNARAPTRRRAGAPAGRAPRSRGRRGPRPARRAAARTDRPRPRARSRRVVGGRTAARRAADRDRPRGRTRGSPPARPVESAIVAGMHKPDEVRERVTAIGRGAQVLVHGHALEQLEALERTAEPGAARRRADHLLTSRPSSSTRPRALTNPVIASISVVLPAPFGPMSPDDLARAAASPTRRRRRWTPPNRTDTSCDRRASSARRARPRRRPPRPATGCRVRVDPRAMIRLGTRSSPARSEA